MDNRDIEDVLTPNEEEQIQRILEGKCPHNSGWEYIGHGHNDDAYRCKACGHIKFW
jgi:hypothetical protein